jgi:molecular chaperone GrpE
MTTSGGDIINNGTDGHGEASAGRRSSLGRTKSDPADAETVSGSTSGVPPVSSGTGGTAIDAIPDDQPEPGLSPVTEPKTGFEPEPEPKSGSEPEPGSEAEPEPDELTRVGAERDEFLDLARRTQAEFENFRKRAARERAELRARTVADVIRDLLPVVDNIDRALEAAESGAGDGDALLQGIRLVHGELHGFLDRLGLTAINPAGEKFDPALHEAIASVPTDGVESGVITDVHQKGFSLDEIVVRPARVVVSA